MFYKNIYSFFYPLILTNTKNKYHYKTLNHLNHYLSIVPSLRGRKGKINQFIPTNILTTIFKIKTHIIYHICKSMVIDLITKLEIIITFIYGLKSFFPLIRCKKQ